MKILALEFSTLSRSAAILEISNSQAQTLASATQPPQRAGSPFPLLEQLFEKISREQIEGIAVGLGPGSYTGIRSSLAIAQGWNLSRNIPAAGVSSADAIAWEALNSGTKGPIEVVIDAQRGEVYSAGYQLSNFWSGLLHVEDERRELEARGPSILHTRPLEILKSPRGESPLVGPEATRWNPAGLIFAPTAIAVGHLAAKREFMSPELLEPIYLREPSFVKAPAPLNPN